ncbi:unnamed protein product [Schistosoma turkestanicum]|nr:unnamed protein product [Schistosoma turkestanicum]
MKHKLSTCDLPSSFKLRRLEGGCSRVHHKGNSINSLLDLSARVVAEYLPFEYVERMLVHIPEPVQEKIIYYSFPQRDSDIYTYASFHSKTDKTRDKIPYYQGLEYFQNNCVENVIQIGFHLTGSVRQQPTTCISETEGNKFKVSITFDRCKIISVCCDCGNKGLSWCPHVVALALFRIRQPHLVDYRSPISDALVRMNRSQLQKFAQYLIASHPNKILPSAQQLADQLLQPESNINKTSGAPDPTAGGSLQDVAAWYLDEIGVREQLRVELTNLASNGLYGTNSNLNSNLRLSSTSGRCNSPTNNISTINSNGQQQQQNTTTNNRSSSSSSFVQRSNSSNRSSHPNSSGSLGIADSGIGRQNDHDYQQCTTEVGLDWLLRYRRLTLNQNLLIGGTNNTNNNSHNNTIYETIHTCNNSYMLHGLDLAFHHHHYLPSLSMNHHQHHHHSEASSNSNTASSAAAAAAANNTNHSNQNNNNNNNNNNGRLYCTSTSPFHLHHNQYHYWPHSSFDTQFDSSFLHHCHNQFSNNVSSNNNNSGTQIPAMFAKVRELLAKRDSNGPRLLSLITEELLNCSKLPLIKSRRNQRNTTNDVVSNRLQTIATPRLSSHGQQSSNERQYTNETLTTNSVNNATYNHNSSNFNQSPPWTVRLWEEVCLLWTCVVLSPDCSVEAKRQWRYRFLTWARANRCPRDESYAIPSHFLTSIHELNDIDDDNGVGQNQQTQQQHQQQQQQQPSCQQSSSSSTRSYRRASVFRLPIEASYMSWDDVWWNQLLSIHDMKLDKHESEPSEDLNAASRHNHSTSISLDENNNDCSRIFRRPSSVTPRRSIGFNNRPFPQSNTSPRECQCPYCDYSGPINEPFPLLCLRVAALRTNGYLSQALQLAVLISQRLLRSVKMKASMAATSMLSTIQRSPPQTSWNNNNINNNNSNNNANNCHDIVARRLLFNTPPQSNNGQLLRVNNNMNSHYVMHNSSARYLSSSNMPPSPSMLPNHGKFSPSSRLTSPRPASLSPPVNVNHHSRSISTRRHGLSPNSNPSPGPSCPTNHQSIIINNNSNNNNNNNNSSSNNSSSNNNNINNNSNNNCWSNQPSYVYKSPSSCQQYANQSHPFNSPHCSPVPPASHSPIPFHNPYHQPTPITHHQHHYHKHVPHSNSPYPSYSCLPPPPPPPPPHGVGGPVGCNNGSNGNMMMMMMHPSHHHNRSLNSPTLTNRSMNARSIPSSYSTNSNGNMFAGEFYPFTNEIDINCGLISTNCPSHTEIGWIGLPGRPILCLVECLLDAAAIVVEAANHQAPSIALPLWGHMEKASFYLCLAVKISLLSLFQQRRLVGSISRLLACQHQETRLLSLLNTIPKDMTTALTMCEILCQLLGPPIPSSLSSIRTMNKFDYHYSSTNVNVLMNFWWWSSLGLIVHSDTYPIHAVAEFVLNYLLDTQKINQFVSFNTCWTYSSNNNNSNNHNNCGNGSCSSTTPTNNSSNNTTTTNNSNNNIHNISSIRIDDMIFTLVTRAMRFSVLDNYHPLMDNPSTMGTHLTRSNSSPQLLSNINNNNNNNNNNTNGIPQNCLHSQRINYNHRGFWDYYNHANNGGVGGGNSSSINSAGGNVETALAVNTEVSDQEFGLAAPMAPTTTAATASTPATTTLTGNMMDSSVQFTGNHNNNMYMNANYDNHQRYAHPPSNPFRWDQSPQQQQQQQQQQPVPDYDRCTISMPSVSVPPLPSVFSMSTQNCLKFNNGYLNPSCNNNNNSNGNNNNNSTNNPSVYPMFNLQNLDSSRWFTPPPPQSSSSSVVTSPPTIGLPSPTIMNNNNNSSNNNHNNNILSLNQNPQYRRCIETLKSRQTRLAVALIRVSKSHIHRLDQIVQICDQNIHSAVSLLAISQQVFAEAVGWKFRSSINRKPNNTTTNLLDTVYIECDCLLNSNTSSSLILPTTTNSTNEPFHYTRDRIFLISTAFHIALIVVLRTLNRSVVVHWRRREILAWAVTTALHVGPSACLYLIYHWSSYVNPREAVSWLAPALLTAVDSSNGGGAFDVNNTSSILMNHPHHHHQHASKSLSTNKIGCSNATSTNTTATPTIPDQSNRPLIDNPMCCFDHSSSLFFNWDEDCLNNAGNGNSSSSSSNANNNHTGTGLIMNGSSDINPYSLWPPTTCYSFCPTSFTTRNHSHSIIMAAQLLNTAVPYSKVSREQITNAVRHMALQAAAKDPIHCALPALNLSVKDPIAFDAIYRLVLNSAESGGLGPIQLFSLARYMDNCGWTWRAFPFALHATRLFVLSTTQESHPVGNDVLWACLLGHRLGPGALQEILNHVIRNIHCPTLLTDILHRCRSIPCGINVNLTNSNNNNSNNSMDSSLSSSSSLLMMNNNNNNNMAMNSIPSTIGRGNSCTTHFCNPTSYYIHNSSNNNNNNNNNNSTGASSGCPGKMLSLDRPPLKGLLDAAINGFVMATHMRLANISPRQYTEFVDFLTRARDTFHLLRPDGPLQFRSLVECLRQTYRGKRKLVALLSERFG